MSNLGELASNAPIPAAAVQAAVPSGKFLRDDGTWQVAGGGSTPSGTGWRHVTAGVEDAASSTPTAADVGAEATGAVATHAALTTGIHGSGANTFIYSNDARLTDARTPTSHAGTHVTGGGDTIAGAVAGGNAGLMTGTDKTKLDGIASGAEVNVNADWNAGSGDAQILNKPSLGTMAALNDAPSDGSIYGRKDGAWAAGAGGLTLADVYPVGCIYTTTVSTNPGTLFGFGTWAAFGAGRVLVGLNSGDTDFDTVEETGGAKTVAASVQDHAAHTHSLSAHTHTYTEVPNHVHVQSKPSSGTGSQASIALDTSTTGSTADTISTQNPTGGVATGTTAGPSSDVTGSPSATLTHTGNASSVVQPYIVVYFFKRTA